VADIDFEAEGLLEGLEGAAREDRRKLLQWLTTEGVPVEELRRAVDEDRLALLPVERDLAGGELAYTANEIASLSGLDRDFLDRDWRALGIALAHPDEAHYTEADLEAARRVAAVLAAGIPEDDAIAFARVLGMATSQVAAAARGLVGGTFSRPGDTEHDLAMRLRDAARALGPILADSVSYAVQLHLREQIRHDVAGADSVVAGTLAGAAEVTVCFADMVGFTRLGERLPVEELGAVSERLAELAAEVATPPVRLVKLIGDAAMLVGPEPGGVLDAALGLLDAAEDDARDLPLLRAGVARGRAVARAGDWYGRPVNLASRITAIARPASVLADGVVREAAGGGYNWSFAGARRVKGIEGPVKLFRCRRVDHRGP
jgi:adenylate cyclase